jgi:hypothetical protein
VFFVPLGRDGKEEIWDRIWLHIHTACRAGSKGFSRQDFLLILIVKASKTESLSEKTQILSFFSEPSIKT